MPLAAPLILPFAELAGITIAGLGMAAASKELAEEKERRDPDSINGNGYAERAEDKKDDITRVQEGMDKHDVEATIPKADTIETESLFND